MVPGFRQALRKALQETKRRSFMKGDDWDIADAMLAYDSVVDQFVSDNQLKETLTQEKAKFAHLDTQKE